MSSYKLQDKQGNLKGLIDEPGRFLEEQESPEVSQEVLRYNNQKYYIPTKDNFFYIGWLEIAEKDLCRAKWLLDYDDAELAGFCLQQAVEKFLKAFLISKGWIHRKNCNLVSLLNDAISFDSSLEQYREVCREITLFYYIKLYPVITDQGVTNDDVTSAFEQVNNLITKLRTQLKQT
jgi:HEPN domain-containing protein